MVSTYNRPDVLKLALASVVGQTCGGWIAYIVGDNCDARTAAAVQSLGDPRLLYFNLPQRCGDQSGPNAIGAELCETPYLAFLNHDDLLLPDHFELGLKRLAAEGAGLCIGRVARVGASGEGSDAPVLWSVAPALKTFRPPVLASDAHRFEPASAWVLRTEAYRRVGAWRDGADLHRTPFNDWLLRAARAGLRVAFSEPISVLKFDTHHAERGGAGYRASDRFHRLVLERMAGRSPGDFRAWVETEACRQAGEAREAARRVRWARFRAAPPRRKLLLAARKLVTIPLLPWNPLARPLLEALYLKTGVDLREVGCRLLRRRPGGWKARALRERTGDPPPPRADRPSLVEAARAALGGRA